MNTTISKNQSPNPVKSPGAQRVAAHRQKKKDEGLVPVQIYVPINLANRIKESGSFMAWLKQYEWLSKDAAKILHEKIALADKFSRLPSWKKWLINLCVN